MAKDVAASCLILQLGGKFASFHRHTIQPKGIESQGHAKEIAVVKFVAGL
jgi:hypothetical protein